LLIFNNSICTEEHFDGKYCHLIIKNVNKSEIQPEKGFDFESRGLIPPLFPPFQSMLKSEIIQVDTAHYFTNLRQ
jgi:hypothetical protein